MVFAFFQRRRLQKVFSNSAEVMLRMQFIVAQQEPANHADDPWVLGYLYGASTAILDRMGVEPSPEAYKILESGYDAVFASRAGRRVLDVSMDMRQDPDFAEGQAIGGAEQYGLKPDGPMAFALGTYLGDNKTAEIRQRLRTRFLK